MHVVFNDFDKNVHSIPFPQQHKRIVTFNNFIMVLSSFVVKEYRSR